MKPYSSNMVTIISVVMVIVLSWIVLPQTVYAVDGIAEMRQQLEAQRALIQAQQKQLEQQAEQLEKMSQRLDELATSGKQALEVEVAGADQEPVDTAADEDKPTYTDVRDRVGDLNSSAILAGDFPGSFQLPGKGISLAIGGFIKTVAIADSHAESSGANFLPAYLNENSDDEGAFSIDATLSRIYFDGRAPARKGALNGYAEWDFNKGNDGNVDIKMRHVYGGWKYNKFSLLAGHTWSTFMDLKIIPEGLTEPTVSGVIFMRQPQIRVSQAFESGLSLHASLEDPNSDDIFDQSNNAEKNITSVPDAVVAVEYGKPDLGHLRLSGIHREIEVRLPQGGTDTNHAWGASLSGHLDLLEKDKWRFNGVYGKGLGRYLLGIQSSAGGVINPSRNDSELRDNWGIMSAYEHHWNDSLRSSVLAGYARSKPLSWQLGETFESSTYASANLMWEILPYLTFGVEYAYGQRENKDNSDVDNHRLAIGVQYY
jgi:type II secretory pathway pseudopilin PulG